MYGTVQVRYLDFEHCSKNQTRIYFWFWSERFEK
jgi:hypothetical protein